MTPEEKAQARAWTNFKSCVGKKFGTLFVVEYVPGTGPRNSYELAKFRVKCDCGVERLILCGSITSGRTKNCGCIRKTLGALRAAHPVSYRIWCGMKTRCDCPTIKAYKYYGGRGISYDPRWESFSNFVADMGDPPLGLTLDRIDNNGNYCKENCRWADMLTQAQNKRNTRKITCLGKTQSSSAWARELGVHHQTISDWARRGVLENKIVERLAYE